VTEGPIEKEQPIEMGGAGEAKVEVPAKTKEKPKKKVVKSAD